MASERRGGRDAAAEHVRQAPDGNWYTETEWAAWRRDAAAEHARLGAMERRRALDGQAYTADEFRVWYHTTAQEFLDNAQEVRQAPDGNWYTGGVGCVEDRQRRAGARVACCRAAPGRWNACRTCVAVAGRCSITTSVG